MFVKPRRVVFCTTEFRAGGAERCLAQLATRIDRARFAPRVIVLAGAPPSGHGQLVDRLAAAEVPLEFLGASRIWQAPWIARRLVAALRARQPELLQTFLFHANVLGALAAPRAGVPRLVAGVRVAERGVAWQRALQRFLIPRCDRVACVSGDVARFLREQGAPEAKLVTIPNGVDLDEISSRDATPLTELGVRPGRRAIACIGRLEPQKRVESLLEWLAENAAAVFASHDLLIVGEGPLREALVRRSRELAIDRYVHFLGWREDAVGILKSCDLLVHAAAWEGMANVVLEAMACRRPVVTCDAEGMRELLGAESAQIVSREGAGFAGRVRAILEAPAEADRLGESNRRRAEERFGIDRMVGAYEELYSELLA